MTSHHHTDPRLLAAQAAGYLARLTAVDEHDVAVVLGSGWAGAAERIKAAGTVTAEIDLPSLPGFAAPVVAGHVGKVLSIEIRSRHVLVFLGRTHLYEGRGVEPVVHGVRTAAAAGVKTLLLTNAAGGLRQGLTVQQPVLISDHLNLTAHSPLTGATFVDLTDLYSKRLRAVARTVDPTLEEGVYAALPGPHFETPAEINYLRTIGADLVGMSTALEAIAARAAGVEVMGLSLVTNLAAGTTGEALDHHEVLAAGQASATRVGDLLAGILSGLQH